MKHCPQCGNLFLSKKFTSVCVPSKRCVEIGWPILFAFFYQEGAIFQLQAECHKCGNVSWSSSPTIAPTKVATINVDLASSFFLSAVNTAAVYRLANSMALSLPTQKTLSIHQQAYLYPAIAAKFLSQQAAFVDELKGRGEIHLSGDGRFSKPGNLQLTLQKNSYFLFSFLQDTVQSIAHILWWKKKRRKCYTASHCKRRKPRALRPWKNWAYGVVSCGFRTPSGNFPLRCVLIGTPGFKG